MLNVNVDDTLADLLRYKEEVERKLKGMVEKFSYNIATFAINTTPYGSTTYTDSTGNTQINDFYYLENRADAGLFPAPGHAKGGWIVALNHAPTDIGQRTEEPSASDVKARASATLGQFKLGDTIYIVNNVPYVSQTGMFEDEFGALNAGYSKQAPRGISEPTFEEIMNVYNLDLVRYYELS